MPSHPLEFMRLPFWLLVALDSRMLHFWMQPVHYLVRVVHILSMSMFFGAVMVIDLRLMSRTARVSLRPLAELVLPWLHWSFAVCFATGIALFFYDPVHIGSHAYLTPKLLLIAIAMTSAWIGHKRSFKPTFFGEAQVRTETRVTAALSLLLWAGVIVCSCLNVEAVPKVFLR
jgi:hypothetical protein